MPTHREQRTAVVTGASSGLGLEVAKLLHAQGMQVFALARSIATAKLPDGIVRVPLNIRDLQNINHAFATIDAQATQLDILVNCAGRGLTKDLEHTTPEEIMDVFGVNLKGNIYVAQEVYRRMLKFKSGHIINVGSTSSLRARPNEPIYAASKWGLRGFTESLRLAAAPHGIRVTGVYPGGMKTDFWADNPQNAATFMPAQDVALAILAVLNAPSTTAPAEYIIERP